MVYVDAVSCLHMVYVDATACLHMVQVICYLVITWFCVNLPQLLQHQLSKFWACECQMHIVPVWSCHNCCSKGGVAVTKALRILALPRLAWPPRPAPQSWHSGGFDNKKCVNATSNNWWRNKHIFGVKIIFGEMSTDWELNPSSRSPPSSHPLSPNDFEALSPSLFCNFVICFFSCFDQTLVKPCPWSECKLGKLVFLVVTIGPRSLYYRDLYDFLGPFWVPIYISGSLFSVFLQNSRKECQISFHVHNMMSKFLHYYCLLRRYASHVDSCIRGGTQNLAQTRKGKKTPGKDFRESA